MKHTIAYYSILCMMNMSLAYTGDASQDPEKLKGKIKAEVMLDNETGYMTYLLRCVSEKPVRIHLKTLDTSEIDLSIEPAVNLSKVELEPGDGINPYEGVSFPYGMDMSCRVAGAPRPEKPKLDRVVDLKKGEAVSKSFLIWKTPWWKKLVAKLQKRKYSEYRIHPSPTIYTVDQHGKPVRDHQIDVWVMERGPDGKLGPVFKTKGFTIDLKLVKRLQALQTKTRKKVKAEANLGGKPGTASDATSRRCRTQATCDLPHIRKNTVLRTLKPMPPHPLCLPTRREFEMSDWKCGMDAVVNRVFGRMAWRTPRLQ